MLDPTPGAWEFAFAYDNVPDTFPSLGSDVPVDLTIGVENEAGDAGTEIFSGKFDGGMPVSDGLVICFDYERPGFAPVTITYQATVDADYAGGTLVNEAESTIASPGFQTETTSAAVEVSGLTPRDQIRVVRDAIHDYPSTGDWVADLRLSLAERRLTRALRDVNWIDDQTLAPRRGQRVFAQLAAAAHAIARADRRIDDDLSGWSDALVKASRELAAAALPAERSSWAATYFFERAERTRRSYGAIVLYGVAWDFAT